MKIVSWNVNGIRAVHKKGAFDELVNLDADIFCIQETKAQKEQLGSDILDIDSYTSEFFSAVRKGYSGVATYSKTEPVDVQFGLGIERFDQEGRTLITEYEKFILYNIYYPNGKASKERLNYKMDFYDAFLEHVEISRKKGKGIVVCGDVNTAHKEIDLARPKENSTKSGFLPEERAWIDKFLDHGYVDTLRIFNQEPDQYSWWDYKTRARARNVGWRIDYFFVNDEFKNNLKDAFILADVMGSDHCPIGIELDLN
ncbi:MAG: exodeoxyribonuclease III [Anaerolineaceae bacterium]|nr:exodeoxyribonuclease III [Anaerolineaceae bacterium]